MANEQKEKDSKKQIIKSDPKPIKKGQSLITEGK